MSFQKNCFSVFVLIITCVFVLQAPVTYGRSSIDLVNAKINEFPIFELTLDKVTDLFGRPSVVEPPCIIGEKFGAFLHYHDEGLTFIFFTLKVIKNNIAQVYPFIWQRSGTSGPTDFTVPMPGKF